MKASAGIGAAVFAVGLSLAGAHGTANADSADADSAAVTASRGASQPKPGPARAKRQATARSRAIIAPAAEPKRLPAAARRRTLSARAVSPRVRAAAIPPAPAVVAAPLPTVVETTRIDFNPNFAYGDALLATVFSNLAYKHRDAADFTSRVEATGWQGIGVAATSLGANGFAPGAGGFGVLDGNTMDSYAFAGKRTAADGTEQFVVSFEGTNGLTIADWSANVTQYGWSRYYASLEPLLTEVVGQMLEAQNNQQKTQLLITGHSLGGAAAEMAFADLLAPQGNLWPDTSDVLAAGNRVLDTVGGWSDATRTALLAATSVYTFGAPSILIEPTKPRFGWTDLLAYLTVGTAKLLSDLQGLTVNDKKLPDLSGIAGISFGSRVFQFEHANTSWFPPYPGDIVAQIGSRDPGTVLAVNLRNSIHTAYAGWLSLLPGGTHSMKYYRESVLRLITNSKLLKNPNDLAANTPQLTPTAAGQGSDARNDYFVNLTDSGKAGNDVFAYTKAGTYAADGGPGTDTYSVGGYGITLTIDGALQSGRDSLVFNVAGTPTATYDNSNPSDAIAVFSVADTGGKSSTVTVTHWNLWQITDVFQVISPADGKWTLNQWTDVNPGPLLAVTPADQIPLSVL